MDDRLVLAEYEQWRLTRIGQGAQPLGVEAFLAEREHGFNASRIAEALAYVNVRLHLFERAEHLDGDDARTLVVLMNEVRDILAGDRPFVEDSTLTGPTTRTYL